MSIFLKLNRLKRSDLYDPNDVVGIQIVYYYGGKRFSTSTRISVKVKDWNEKWRTTHKKDPIFKSDIDFKDKNLLLKQKLKEIKDIVFEIQKDNKEPIVNLVKSHLKKHTVGIRKTTSQEIHFEILFQEYFNWIKSDDYKIQTQNSDSYVRSLIGSMKDIIQYTKEHQNKNGFNLLPSDINREFTNGLIRFCDKKGLQPSTIKKRFKSLVSFGKWLEETHNIRFIVHKTNKSKSIDKGIIWLDNDELKLLFDYKELELTNKNHPKHLTFNKKQIEYIFDKTKENKGGKVIKYTSYEVYKDMLLFLCGTGMRYGDLCKLKIEDFKFITKNNFKRDGYQKGEIEYVQEKTFVKVRVPISKLVFEIYKKYVKNRGVGMYLFPKTKNGNSISNQKFNKHIKQVCRIAGLKRFVKTPKYDWNNNLIIGSDKLLELWEIVTSHIGRRTFIRELVDNGKDRKTVMSITGHKSYKTLDVYYESTENDRFKNHDSLHSSVLSDTSNKMVKNELSDELQKLRNLYNEGLIPEEIYHKRVSELLC